MSLIDNEQVAASEYLVIEDDSKTMRHPRLIFEAEIEDVQKAVIFDPVKDLMSDEALKDV